MLITLIWKDLLVILRDKKALVITLCMPAVLITILGFAFQGLMADSSPMGPASIGIVNIGSQKQDIERIKTFLDGSIMKGRLSDEQREDLLGSLQDLDFERFLCEGVLESSGIEEFIQYEKMDIKRAQESLEKDELTAIVVLPEGFTYDVFMSLLLPFRNPVAIEIIKHPDKGIKGEIVSGIIKGFTDALSAGIIAKNVMFESAIENNAGDRAVNEIEGLISDMYDTGLKDVNVNRVTASGKKIISSFQYYAVGMAVMFILYVAADGGQYSMDEINNNTYMRSMIAGVGNWRFFVSRFIAATIFALFQFVVLILYSILFFRTEWGDPVGVILISIFLALSVGGLSVFLASVNLKLKNNRASIVFQSAIIQIFALLGGSFFPVSGIPIMQRLGRFTINGAAMDGLLKLMMGYNLKEVTGTCIILFSTASVLVSAGMFIAAKVREV